MKALTLYQPWASLVALGQKKIETRSWATKYRGPLAIHVAKTIIPKYMNLAWEEPFYSALAPLHTESGGIRYPWQCVIAIVDLVDVIQITPDFIAALTKKELAFGDYTPGRYAWILENIRPIDLPVMVKGKQGLWNWEPPEGFLEGGGHR